MTKRRVLVLESNSALTDRIVQTLALSEQIEVCHETTVWGACQELARRTYDLAIIPERDASWPTDSFRAIQPDMPIVITVVSPFDRYLEKLSNVYDGILRAEMVESDLPTILTKLWVPTDELDLTLPGSLPKQGIRSAFKHFQSAGQSIVLAEGIRQILLFNDGELLTFPDKDQQASEVIAAHLKRTWDGIARTAQIQFAQLEEHSKPILLYTRPIKDHFLALVADHDVPIDVVRRQATQLMNELKSLEEIDRERENFNTPTNGSIKNDNSYHLVWWPIQLLPEAMQMFVHQAVRRQARINACIIQHLEVTTGYVYAVLACPPNRSSSWAAHLLKSGVESEIFKRFGKRVSVWRKGYFAADAQNPPSDLELDIILHTTTGNVQGN